MAALTLDGRTASYLLSSQTVRQSLHQLQTSLHQNSEAQLKAWCSALGQETRVGLCPYKKRKRDKTTRDLLNTDMTTGKYPTGRVRPGSTEAKWKEKKAGRHVQSGTVL